MAKSIKKINTNLRQRQNRRLNNANQPSAKQRMVKAPIAQTLPGRQRDPIIRQNGKVVVVSHREYVADITSTNAAYRVTSFPVNPGQSSTYPWLSIMANRFESYLFERLDFVYEPICPTTTPGSIMMATDFDASDTPPSDKVTLMSYEGAARIAPWERQVYRATPGNLHKFGIQRYTRPGAVPAGTDIKTYDVGNFFIASQSTPTTATTLGELYVEYTVKLFTPQIPPTTSLAIPFTATQATTVTVGINAAATSLAAKINGSVINPLLWIFRQDANFVDLLLNVNRMRNFLVAINHVFSAGTQAGGNTATNAMRFFPNAKPGFGADTNSAPYALTLSSAGDNALPIVDTSNQQTYVLNFTTVDIATAPVNPGLVPIRLVRPATGTFKYNFTIIPTTAPVYAFNSNLSIGATDWDYPQVALPILPTLTSVTRDVTVVDGPNSFEVLTDDLTE